MIRTAILGVGNVASALVQALEMVKQGEKIQGCLTSLPYKPEEIEVVAAFDIDKRKVGYKLREAIFQKPNVVPKYVDVRNDVVVKKGVVLDSLEGILERIIELSDEKESDISQVLKDEKVDVVINLLPTGVVKASEYYAEEALKAGSAFINATPTSLVNQFSSAYKEKGIPIFGDDLLSQIGGTSLHTGLIEFLKSKGVQVLRTYQVDIAGNTEVLVTLEDWRKDLKKGIKSHFISKHIDGAEVVAGTTDYVEFLGDRRVSYIVVEGLYSFGIPVRIDVSLKSQDAPNAVAPLVDLIRIAKVLKESRVGGSIPEVSGYYFKKPPVVYSSMEESRKVLSEYISKFTS
ncbi:myo-inositol-1-phosphate synthase [Sulfolobus acidocaldarius SUSAZ]|nr:myo-inositol-1-phosphate synthase [Sulfolobus acidocaldarius SUSAZ]